MHCKNERQYCCTVVCTQEMVASGKIHFRNARILNIEYSMATNKQKRKDTKSRLEKNRSALFT